MSLNTIKVYFDGNCGLCSKEINYYRKIDKKNIFEWVNIYIHDNKCTGYNELKYFMDTFGLIHLVKEKTYFLTDINPL